jgi:hypothetical protein
MYLRQLLLFQRNITFLVIIVGIFGNLLIPILGIDFVSATSDEERGDTSDGDDNGGSDNGGGGGNGNDEDEDDNDNVSANECQGQADCFRGTVTEVIDGDTLDIDNVRVRLALVNTPERGENGYKEAVDFVQSVCDIGTTGLVDEDDGQKEGSFDRVIGLIYCGNDNINNKKSLNELLLERGYAVIYQDFCGISEFSSSSWAQSRGC